MQLEVLVAVLALAAQSTSALHLSDTRLNQVYNYMDTFAKYS